MDDLLSEFLTETNESMEELDTQLITLEQDPNNKEILNNIFRLVHTIKGTCGFLGLPRLEKVAHAGENVLGKFRDGDLSVTPEYVTLILESLDRIKELLEQLEATEAEPEGNDSDLIAKLNKVVEAAGKAGQPEPEPEPEPESASVEPIQEVSLEELEAAFQSAPGPEDGPGDEDEEAAASGNSLFDQVGGTQAVEATVDLFYDKLIADDSVKGFFEGIDMDSQRHKLAAFVGTALGASGAYDGRSLREAHAPLVEQGLNDAHFDTVAKHLADTLEELGVDEELISKVMVVIGSTRTDILAGPEEAAESAGEAVVAAPEKEQPKQVAVAEDTAVAKPKEGGSGVNQTIRVSVDLLEDLMNMVSELVLTRNQLMQMVRRLDDSEFSVPLQRLSHCTTELQEGVMKTRMQPIGNAWAKLPRIIRDLSLELDKKIDLVMLGADTELDRQVLELIKDPLTHMVRNSADHGLEGPKERLAAGKPAVGKVTLNAYHEGGHIIIEIADDGRGLSLEPIKKKALENGLVTQEELEALTEQQIHQFIMRPGFSTATKVTSVSGRGVGMDVVRSNIEKIGGTVEFTSKQGQGTRFLIKIPLTLAIVAALIVEAAGERFAIPQLSVVELVRASGDSEHRIEKINDTPVLRLRNRLLPLVRLDEALKLEPLHAGNGHDPVAGLLPGASAGNGHDAAPGEQSQAEGQTESEAGAEDQDSAERTLFEEYDNSSEVKFIVVAQAGPQHIGIVVDRVYDSEEIVVKPVSPVLRDLGIFSGNTILGDGSVIMILDPTGIAVSTSEQFAEAASAAQREETQSALSTDTVSLLVFHAGSPEPKAVPLALVARLEEIDVSTIESTESGSVVQYRGQLMPLVLADRNITIKEEGRQSMLVFSDERRSMGLVVDEIVDIVDQALDVELVSSDPGIVGTAVVDGKATEIIDVAYFLTQAFGDWFSFKGDSSSRDGDGYGSNILLVDDSPFFRNMLMPVLTVAGYKVTAAGDATEALLLRDEGRSFDVIISDIEMPEMDGFEFAAEIKASGLWQDIPLIALSSHTGTKDFERGREAGFDDYVAKSDRDALLAAINQTLTATGDSA